ncbi:hypothetical protein ATANTOWER_014340 [Ataeniobius toweri]|uniref:Distal membrane-arm assembly complex protein 1-like domain-containing protein n=1 Tax=Ataeniobius toweri TaxID=208326 RepID=A0ABU7ABU9_9TELE|nr:hypothetical protein [Ataeniobius toweri]
MSTAPESTAASSKSIQAFKNCWSCRVISGGGLILSGAYVFSAARRVMRQGASTSMGTVAQITFAAGKSLQHPDMLVYLLQSKVMFHCDSLPGLAAWGLVIITDPVGKAQRKTT